MAKNWSIRTWTVKSRRKHGKLIHKRKEGTVTYEMRTPTLAKCAEQVKTLKYACTLLNEKDVHPDDIENIRQSLKEASQHARSPKIKSQ